MNKTNIIFSVILGAFLAMPVMAADNGCGTDTNDFINPDIALCSVHAYNTNAIKNPTTLAEKQEMNDIVALKTTVITQQMKKQYDYLEATIKRFKTQLEKAILTAEMEAAGAAPDKNTSGGASGSSTSNYLVCGMKSAADTIRCVRQNIGSIYSELSNKNDNSAVSPITLKRQLETDANNVNSFIDKDIVSCAQAKLANVLAAKTCIQDINGGLNTIEGDLAKRTQPSR